MNEIERIVREGFERMNKERCYNYDVWMREILAELKEGGHI